MIGDSGYTIQGGGDPKRRWSKGCFSPTSGRLPRILKEKEVGGRGEMPLLRLFENLGGWLKYECRGGRRKRGLRENNKPSALTIVKRGVEPKVRF
jgi:hypothetical protein